MSFPDSQWQKSENLTKPFLTAHWSIKPKTNGHKKIILARKSILFDYIQQETSHCSAAEHSFLDGVWMWCQIKWKGQHSHGHLK